MVEQTERKFQKVKDWFNGKPSGPFKLKILPTYRCNLSCKFCRWGSPLNSEEINPLYTWDKRRPQKELAVEKWLEIIEEASEMDCEKVDIIGGEPFVRRDEIISILRKIKNENMYGQVTTNGTLLNSNIAKEIVEMEWDSILISIDSPRALIHDFFRGKVGTFKRATKGIEQLSKWKEELNGEYPQITITCILSKWSVNELKEMIELADFYDVDRLNLTPLFADFKSIEKYKVDRIGSGIVEKLRELEKMADQRDLENNFQDVYKNEIIMTEDDKYDTIKREITDSREDEKREVSETKENEIKGDGKDNNENTIEGMTKRGKVEDKEKIDGKS